ncbi:helix-turn-helix transcriptional regulator [Chitinophaga sp. Mgbs1]|uniref:Helix-turn-helix transcriptional regulator n=1 Tax=Chitinophaga solisilvae TaxID=1233460 RepID=A0A3S1D659_9BACT|nr:helix-turn-helix transcriptional regulator [Chitinophaga solisilvae]
MHIQITYDDVKEIILEHQLPENYQEKDLAVSDRTISIDQRFGKGTYREILFEGIHIAYGDLRFKDRTSLRFTTDFETVEMHFDLYGANRMEIEGFRPYEFATNRHNIIYAPGIKGKIHFEWESIRTLEINLLPSLFRKYLPEGEVFDTFLHLISRQSPALLVNHNLPITPAMMQLINAILNCTRSGIYKRLFLESKVFELLMLQLEQCASHDCHVFCSLKKVDIEKMYHAREIIEQQIHNPCSLIDLARQVGTNEFKLKKGFKELFGTTVYGMVGELKMEQAKDLLLSGEMNIAEVSEFIGYKNATHFTQAFKKKFGVTPGAYKK